MDLLNNHHKQQQQQQQPYHHPPPPNKYAKKEEPKQQQQQQQQQQHSTEEAEAKALLAGLVSERDAYHISQGRCTGCQGKGFTGTPSHKKTCRHCGGTGKCK